MQAALRIEDLTKHYKKGLREKIVALRGLSLEVHQGEILGLVGPNGAGKSTTIKIIMNLLFPTKGRVEIMGINARSPKAREHLGYLPENPSFYDHLTGEEFLLFTGRLLGMEGNEGREKAWELLRMVRLEDAGRMAIRKYSKGMAQRLGIAQALMGDPRIVVMDEPMSGLDPIGRAEVSQLILSLKKQEKTIFFSSHILHDVEAICDRVGILVEGRLTYLGTPSRIVSTPTWLLKIEGDYRGILREKGLTHATMVGRITQVEIQEDELWEVMDAVRGCNLPIYSLEKRRCSLEEIFAKEVGSETAG